MVVMILLIVALFAVVSGRHYDQSCVALALVGAGISETENGEALLR